MGIFVCRISKAFQAHFTCSLKGWKLDINKIKLRQFLRDLWWGFLSSRSALAWGFLQVCCSIACFDQCCWALLLYLSTEQPNQRVAALFINLCPLPSPPGPPKPHIQHTELYLLAQTLSNLLSIVQERCPNSSIFIRNMTLIFPVWKSWSVFKHFFLHNRPSARGKK